MCKHMLGCQIQRTLDHTGLGRRGLHAIMDKHGGKGSDMLKKTDNVQVAEEEQNIQSRVILARQPRTHRIQQVGL